MDHDAGVEQALAGRMDVVDREREMPEEATGRVGLLLVPVVGQLDGGGVLRMAGGQEDERETTLLAVFSSHLTEPEVGAEEGQRGIEVADAEHGVQEPHGRPPGAW